MLSCQQLTELVTDYLEGRLSLRQRIAFHLHLGMCSRCRAYLKQMRLTVETMGRLEPKDAPPMPPDVSDELLRRFKSWKK